jgi:hypothetical protein
MIQRFPSEKILEVISRLLFGPDDQVPFVYQPMMKLVGGISTIRFAYLPDLLIFLRALFLSFQFQLNRTLHIFTELSSFVIDISLD